MNHPTPTLYPTLTLAAVLVIALSGSAQVIGGGPNLGGAVGGTWMIPPTGSGSPTCSPTNEVVIDVDVARSGTVESVFVVLDLVHTFQGDLVITLEHGGTSVVLADGSTLSSLDLNGTYMFFPGAPTAWSSPPTGGSTLPPGSYAPDGDLSAFTGAGIAGRWTLRICDDAGADVGMITRFLVQAAVTGETIGATNLGMSLGGGNHDFVFTSTSNSRQASDILVELEMTTTNTFGDVFVSIAHNGITRFVHGFDDTQSDFDGTYIFTKFANALPAGMQGVVLAPGAYQPTQSFAPFDGESIGGTWTVRISNATGSPIALERIAILIAAESYEFSLSQPQGASSLHADMLAGSTIGNLYQNFFTLTQGGYPHGWFFGIDITIPGLIAALTLQDPILNGVLDTTASASADFFANIPPGLALYATSLELTPTGAYRQADTADHVTHP